MRKRFRVLVGAVAGVGLVAGFGVGVIPGTDHRPTARSEPTHLVSYHGYQAQVPASWPVYDLSKDPSRCVRFDQHAVYLGTPGPDQDCPAHIVGRTEALLVEPLAAPTDTVSDADSTLQATLSDAGVAVTASYLDDRQLASSLVDGSTVAPTLTPTPTASFTVLPGTSPDAGGDTTGTGTPPPSASPSMGGSDGSTPSMTVSGTTTPDPSDSGTPSPTTSASDTDPTVVDQTDPIDPPDSEQSDSADQASPMPSGSGTPTTVTTASSTPSGTTSSSVPSGSPSSPTTPAPEPALDPAVVEQSTSDTVTSTSTDAPLDDHMTITSTETKPSVSRITVSRALITAGYGFDTCAAPSLTAMSAWAPTALNAVGIYIGGVNRSCPDGNLSATWVSRVRGYGYTFIPIYVGRQAPCVDRTNLARIDPAQAEAQGASAASDAVNQMTRFGLGRGNPVYLDIEYYVSDATCGPAVLRFLSGWTKQLHAKGYASGVYATATSTANDIAHLDFSTSTYALPDALWFARWNGLVNLDAKPYVPDWMWPSSRIKQYTGGHQETHGGVTINIDRNYLHGPIALPGSH